MATDHDRRDLAHVSSSVLLSITPSAHGKPSRQPQPALRGPKQRVRAAFGNLMMYCAASRSVTSGFRPGNVIGWKNR